MFNNINSLLTGPVLTQAYQVAAWGDIFYDNFKVFLWAFPKLQKAAISFVTSVQLSICIEQLGSHWTNFHES